MKNLDVHTYSIVFKDIQTSLINLIEGLEYSSIFVLVDENTRQHCLPLLQDEFPSSIKYIEIKSGELNKNLETCQFIWSSLLEQGADRQSVLINLGGGVIGDMGGFCASTFMRGIRFIQIPTTLLSQVDASVGSKLGVDFQGVKNIIGVFNDPIAVLIDSTFLQTLSQAELRSGYAEIIKHALINDAQLWEQLLPIDEVNHQIEWGDIIYRSVEIKQKIVEQDRSEKSLRKILNFGHTIGHAIESYFLNSNSPLLHGEAVAWGMFAECILSHQLMDLTEADMKNAQAYIEKIYGDKRPIRWDVDALIDYMRKDKKNVNQKISFSLLTKIGQSKPDQFVPETMLADLLRDL